MLSDVWLDALLQTAAAVVTVAATSAGPTAQEPGFERQPLVRVQAPVAVRDRPGGRVVARIAPRTGFGSPAVAPVVERRGGWLRVLTPARASGLPSWVRDDARLRPSSTQVAIRADLSAGRLTVRGNGWRRGFAMSSGRGGSPTPPGSYAVTDRISGRLYGGTYGLAVLALSGHQPDVPSGWAGGTRLAIHGRPDGGRSASSGCLVVSRAALAWLRSHVPLGTVVRVVR